MADVPGNLIPTRITQLPDAPVASEDGLLLFVYQGNNYKVRAGDLLSVAGVPNSRQVIAGTGMTGGGHLSSNVAIGIANGGVNSTLMSNTGVAAGAYGNSTTIPVFTVDVAGRVTAASSVAVSVSGFVPESRQVVAGSGLLGGGSLNASVTLSANFSNSTPRAAFQSGLPGTATSMSRNDHQHPAVDLSLDNQVGGTLGLVNGGTARSLVMDPGALIWSGSNGLYVGPAGLEGQVAVSGGAGAPTWGSALVVSNQTANLIYSGPASGSAAPTDFRNLVNADLPDTTVVPSTYGSTTQVGQFTVNAKGLLTLAAPVNIAATTYNGVSVVPGGSGTITATTTNPLAIGTGLLGSSYNGSSAVTISINSTVATLTGSQTLTNKAISGSTNTLTNIANSSLVNSSVSYGTIPVSLGGSSLLLSGLTSVAVTRDPINALELTTKQYVDAAVSSLTVHAPVKAGTTSPLTSVYDNGASGVGATLTNTGVLAAFSTDGYIASLNDRILVKNQTSGAENGVYDVTVQGSVITAWVLTRSSDYNTSGTSANQISSGDYLFIQQGSTLSSTGWVQTTPQPIIIGVNAISFTQFSGAGTYTAGTGLTLTGTLFSITGTTVVAATYGSASTVPRLTVNAQGQLTSVVNTNISISNTAVSGLGTMSIQNANTVAITGGAINNTPIGATTPSTGVFTTVTATGGMSGGIF